MIPTRPDDAAAIGHILEPAKRAGVNVRAGPRHAPGVRFRADAPRRGDATRPRRRDGPSTWR